MDKKPPIPPSHQGRKSTRTSRSTRQPNFSPINDRRTEEERNSAKEKTTNKKKAIKLKREIAHLSQGILA